MTHPPRLAVALLQHFVRDEALVGDLLEEYESRRSRLWLWRQVCFAMVTRPRNFEEIRPLRLVDAEGELGRIDPPVERRRASNPVNLAVTPRGSAVGGFGLVAIGVLVTAIVPKAWVIVIPVVLITVLGGFLLGIILVALNRQRVIARGEEPGPGIHLH
jgi:hypothetical protein